MAIDLKASAHELITRISHDLLTRRMAVVRDVVLPRCFSPAMTDLVLLPVDGRIELYMSAANRYQGRAPAWLEIMSRPPAPGGARLVAICPPEALAAVQAFWTLVDEARSSDDAHGAVATGQSGRPRPPLLDEGLIFARLAAEVRGQDQALRTLAALVARHVARTRPRRPAVALAVGPTGVGKTLAAMSLPAALRAADPGGADYSFLRLDMNEYSESHRVSQLLGAPPGYVGYHDGSQLAARLRENRRTIILFDELDKASRLVQSTMMNALDAGRLSSTNRDQGTWEIDCRSAIFIFTAHVDAPVLFQGTERAGRGRTDTAVRAYLRTVGILPEFLGRIRSFLVFQPMSEQVRAEVLDLAIRRIADEYGLSSVRSESGLVNHLLTLMGDDGFGARPYEFLVDDVLGPCFSAAASTLGDVPLVVSGPPYRCASV